MTEFFISLQSSSDYNVVCGLSDSGLQPAWHDGDGAFPDTGDTVYQSNNTSSPWDGLGEFWKQIPSGDAMEIDAGGAVGTIQLCI